MGPALLLVSFGMFLLIDWIPGVNMGAGPVQAEMPVRDRLMALGVMAAIAVPLLALARKLILGRRRLVLFLRRFGDSEAMAAVTSAAVGAPGTGYRLVTLDDRSTTGSAATANTPTVNTLTVNDDQSLEVAVARVRRLSGRLLGAKTVFLDVGDPIWRNVVLRLVAETNAVLIDVTQPGPSLLWEIETVGAIVRPSWILVGEREALTGLANLDLNDRETTSSTTLAGLLRGEDVLAYRIDEDGRRFGRTLQAKYDLVTRPSAVGRTTPMVVGIPSPDLTPEGPAMSNDREGPAAASQSYREGDLPSEGPRALAAMGERWAARWIDVAIGWLVFMVIAGIAMAVRAATQLPESDGDWLTNLTTAAVLIVVVAYDPLSTLLFGATLGKRLLHLEVVRAGNHQPASVALVGARGLILVALWLAVSCPGF